MISAVLLRFSSLLLDPIVCTSININVNVSPCFTSHRQALVERSNQWESTKRREETTQEEKEERLSILIVQQQAQRSNE